jgi:hypothetical protein
VTEDSVREEVEQLTGIQLEIDRAHAYTELQKILDDEGRQPITYNHYYTDNIQNARQDALKKDVQKAMKDIVDKDWNGKLHVSNTSMDSERLCDEAIAGLNAYYKVYYVQTRIRIPLI